MQPLAKPTRDLGLGRPVDSQAGYTLSEMLVVMAIIGLLAAVLTPALTGQLARARSKAAQLKLETVAASVENFRSDVGRFPTTEEGLEVLVKEPAGVDGWTGPYLRDAKALDDPWGRKLAYRPEGGGEGFVIETLGGDGKPGGSGAARDLRFPTPP